MSIATSEVLSGMNGRGSVGSVAGLLWLLWSVVNCLLAPTQAFVLLSSYPAYTRQYEVGTLYSYSYETSVLLNEPRPVLASSARDVGFKIRLVAQITPVWQHPSKPSQQLLHIQVSSPKLAVKSRQDPPTDGFTDRPSRLDSLPSTPMYALYDGGSISKVFVTKQDTPASINIKKGIASLLQVQGSGEEGRHSELDASGQCDARYVPQRNTLLKLKTNCTIDSDSLYYQQTNKVLGALINSSVTNEYELRSTDSALLTAKSLEVHSLAIAAKQSSAAQIISTQTLKLKSEQQQTSVSQVQGHTEAELMRSIAARHRQGELQVQDLNTVAEEKECIACKTLQDSVSSFKVALKASNLGTQSSAVAFIRLLRKMRESSESDIKAVLNSKKNGKIIPQLLDIVASTQTEASHRAAMDFLNFQHNTAISLPERYLLTVSLATHPSATIIRDLSELMKRGVANSHLQETLVYTVASLVKTYSLMPNVDSKQPLVFETTKYFQDKLASCDRTPCMLLYISALKTLQQRSSIALLMSLVKTAPKKASVNAMRAIQTMPREFLTDAVLKDVERVFLELDRKYDSSVKIIAADLLLQYRPTVELLQSLLQQLPDQKNKEINTALLSRVRDLLEKGGNDELLKAYKNVTNLPSIGNYNVLGQNGLSSAFSRPLSVYSQSTANSSFTNVLEISKGLLKRSTVDVFVDNNQERMRLLSFGMFAGGLDVFGGGADDEDLKDGEEPEEANAGIEITLMDTQLRPYVFFTSKSELMGHVWSGTASERTTALQGAALLQDHMQRVPLQNGFSVEMLLTGAISYDFAGQVQVSLWSQNAHSLVEIGAGMVIQGQARVDTNFVQTMIEFNTGVQTKLEFTSDLEFGSGIAMCMRMSQPDYEIVENVRKLERLPGSKYILRKYKRKSIPGPGKTYLINKKNTLLCNKMFAES